MNDANSQTIKYQRILIKLSGEYFMRDHIMPLSLSKFGELVELLTSLRTMNIEVAIVIGGGNLLRGASLAKQGFNQITSDYMGMLATIINGMALHDCCQKKGLKSQAMSMLTSPHNIIDYDSQKARNMLNLGCILIFVGGTGKPLCTTDTAASQRAVDIKADILLKATKVDGVYPSDPNLSNLANKSYYHHLNYQTVIDQQLNVMDLEAFSHCQKHQIPIRIFNMDHLDSIINIIKGKNIGTLIDNGGKNVK